MDSAFAPSSQVLDNSRDHTQIKRRVPPLPPKVGAVSSKRKPTVYQRVLQVVDGFRSIGTPLDGRLLGPHANCAVYVMDTREIGRIGASLRLRNDRYVVEYHLQLNPVTEEEVKATEASGINPSSLRTFCAFFDLTRLRDRMPTFAPDESQELMRALESIFGLA